MQHHPTAIAFLKPLTTKAEYKERATEKTISLLEMSLEDLGECIHTYYNEKQKIKRDIRKSGTYKMQPQGKRLTKEQVFAILSSGETNSRLSAKYDVALSSIGFIKRGMSYKEYYQEYKNNHHDQ